MNQLEMEDMLRTFAAQWVDVEPETRDLTAQVVSRMSPLNSEDFYRGLFLGVLLPFDQIKGVYGALSSEQQSMISMVLREIASRVMKGEGQTT